MVENCGFSVTWKPQPGRWLHPHNQFLLFTIQESIVSGKRFKMTKLEILNAYFTERLMAAAQEIMHLVGETVMEYQEETVRAKRENESLRRRLREAGLDGEAGLTKFSPPLRADRAVSEHQEWGSTGQDTESTLTAVKLEFSEPQRHRQEEEKHRRLESGTDGSVIPSPCSKRECGPDSLNQPTFPPPCGKRDSVQDPQNHLDLRLQIGNTEEEEGTPSVTHYQIKTETDGADCTVSEEPAEGLFLHKINPASETDQSENSGRVDEDITSRSNLLSEQHSKEHPDLLQGDGSLSCAYCGKVFFLLSRLKSHLRSHTEDSSFQCSVCGKCFSQSGNLNVHQRVHTGKKPYCCSICGKSFNYSGKFKEHQRIHTGERPYRCSFCGKYFSQSGHLKAHVRIHTGEKPYRCPVCGTCFSQLSQIKRHLLTHTQEMALGSHSQGGELH
ncbi:zinc finger and SCAN domain-containing protein 21-like isoform X3 [Anguilla rostrata]|uniref:zinc finger and SCAN domain-containing protein 21-like isoform X3 n=1 Tax=Anguilla rostrata TaxID=7938 RepID=UPI0030D0D5E0